MIYVCICGIIIYVTEMLHAWFKGFELAEDELVDGLWLRMTWIRKRVFYMKGSFFIYEIKKIKEQAVIVKTCPFIFLTIFNCTLYHLYDLCISVIDISSGF